ncbi:MAG: plasmid partition protein ParG [Candidatus Dependentiae bacterium]
MNPKKNELSRIVVDVPKIQHRRLKAMAAARGKSMRIIINELIDDWIDESDQKVDCNHSHTPNKETLKAISNIEKGKKLVQAKDIKDLFEKLES